MFSFLSGSISKYLLTGALAIIAAGGLYLAVVKYQLSSAETQIAAQKQEIASLNKAVETLEFDKGVQTDAIDALEERIAEKESDIDNLNRELNKVLATDKDKNGEVAPVLRNIF